MTEWTTELYEDVPGHSPVETWLDHLSDQKYAAFDAAITWVLRVHGLGLMGTKWLTRVAPGIYEFRIRHTAREIQNMYSNAGEESPAGVEPVLLRVFVTFYGTRIVLLLHGYDKGHDPSEKRQQREIKESKRRLKAWESERAKEAKRLKRTGDPRQFKT